MAVLDAILGLDIVTLAILVSLVGGALVMLVGRTAPVARWLALLISLVPLALSLFALVEVYWHPSITDPNGYLFYRSYQWVDLDSVAGLPGGLEIGWIVGLDGISAPLFFLTALLVTASIIFAWDETRKPGAFHGLLLVLNAAVLGVFAALDLFLFYVFWEFTLVPMFFLIAIWGGPNRKYAAIKFFLYTFTASLVMLLAFMALYFVGGTGSFAFADVLSAVGAGKYGESLQRILFVALFVGFAVKFPVVPFHTWLPDAHVEAPTAGSVILAGVLLKMGSYGLLRVAIPMAPAGALWFQPAMFVIGVVSVLYAAIICLAQTDYKRLVAYSSIGSMGLVLLGLAAMTPMGVTGALFMMVAHGFSSPLLFMLCGVLAHNLGTREIPRMGGLATRMPITAAFLVTASMAGVGLPGLALFPAEFQIFVGIWERWGYLIFLPLLYLIFSAAYYLWAMQRSIFGPLTKDPELAPLLATHDAHGAAAPPKAHGHGVYDVHAFEVVAMAVMVAGLVVYGFFPSLLVDPAVKPVTDILVLAGVR